MMRLNIKAGLLFLTTIGFFTILLLWSVCGKDSKSQGSKTNKNGQGLTDLQGSEEIDCDINGEYVIGCRKEGDEVYLPFSFLHKYFEIYGKLATYDGLERFEWSHSYSKVYHPKSKYDSKGVFMYFENYNVEVRERVKCVSAAEGVPISTQWESQGYFYPTQIAQFGLSHYSKNLTEPEPRVKIIEDGEKVLGKWVVPQSGIIWREFDQSIGGKVFRFKTGDSYMGGIKLNMEHVLDFIMSLNLNLSPNSSLTVTLQNRETGESYNLHYIISDILITAQVS